MTGSAPLLVRRPTAASAQPDDAGHADPAVGRVLDADRGFHRVLGGPGTGKTTLLAEVAAQRIRAGADPNSVLVLTASRRAAAALSGRINALLSESAGDLRTIREPLVRTVHSYAFGVLRLQAARAGSPAPTLLTGPDQDAILRELLAGELDDDGGAGWPARLRPALALPAFAAELRELLLRAAERGLGPAELADLGVEQGRPEWVAAGRFFADYEQVTLLRGLVGADAARAMAPALDAAELVSSALHAFDDDEDLLHAERSRVRCLLVDDAQHLDPQQFHLVGALGETADRFVLAGDPDQAVFSFRGADSRALRNTDATGRHTVVLSVDHRMSPSVRTVARRLTARLPGSGLHREFDGPDDPDCPAGSVQVRLLASAAQEAGWVADQLRRAHLLDGVAWSDMAVIVRSMGRTLPVLRRALLAAGVPVAVPPGELPLAQHGAVRPFLTLVRVAARPTELDPDTAVALLSSPLGGSDPLALRRLRRALRRLELAAGGDRPSGELLVEVLDSGDRLASVEDSAAAPVRRLAGLLAAARAEIERGSSVERLLWRIWQDSGLEKRWVAQSERGGISGRQADRDLDAVVVLFDAAANFTDRLPGADAAGFADYLAAQQIAGNSLAPSAPQGESVTVLTAHSATGREWEVVAVPGVQEGSWPDLRLRGSLLGVERLVDVLAGLDGGDALSATAPLLAEERRLLLVAVSRARRSLLVSAVRGEDEQPSRFLDEIDELASDAADAERPVHRPERGLVLGELVGELRRVVTDAGAAPERRQRAATQLARLAEAGVPGAHPDGWYGLAAQSVDSPLWTDGEPIRVSPSTVEVLAKCPLRWMVERHGGQDTAELASITGTLVHALVQAAADGADDGELTRRLDQAWAAVDAGAPWFSRRERQRVGGMLAAFRTWLLDSRRELTQLAVEHELAIDIPPGELDLGSAAESAESGEGALLGLAADQEPPADLVGSEPAADSGKPWLRLRGRVDRLEVDNEGRLVVVDVKTGRTPVSKDDAELHPQLAVYQLAAVLGAFEALGAGRETGGARLLYVSKTGRTGSATERGQSTLDSDGMRGWLTTVREAGAASAGPAYTARENADCPRCPARTSCPLHSSGRQVNQ